jgi:hypothetical protein
MKLIISELAATLTADIRKSPTYFPPCPLCSSLSPNLIEPVIVAPSAYRQRRGGYWRITRCCPLSDTTMRFESEGAACRWWREKRLEACKWPAVENRRALTLERLEFAGLEAL